MTHKKTSQTVKWNFSPDDFKTFFSGSSKEKAHYFRLSAQLQNPKCSRPTVLSAFRPFEVSNTFMRRVLYETIYYVKENEVWKRSEAISEYKRLAFTFFPVVINAHDALISMYMHRKAWLSKEECRKEEHSSLGLLGTHSHQSMYIILLRL